MDPELAGDNYPVIGGEGLGPLEAELARIFREGADNLEWLTPLVEPALLILAAGILARREGRESPEFDRYLLERLKGIVQSQDAIDLGALETELLQELVGSPAKKKKFLFF